MSDRGDRFTRFVSIVDKFMRDEELSKEDKRSKLLEVGLFDFRAIDSPPSRVRNVFIGPHEAGRPFTWLNYDYVFDAPSFPILGRGRIGRAVKEYCVPDNANITYVLSYGPWTDDVMRDNWLAQTEDIMRYCVPTCHSFVIIMCALSHENPSPQPAIHANLSGRLEALVNSWNNAKVDLIVCQNVINTEGLSQLNTMSGPFSDLMASAMGDQWATLTYWRWFGKPVHPREREKKTKTFLFHKIDKAVRLAAPTDGQGDLGRYGTVSGAPRVVSRAQLVKSERKYKINGETHFLVFPHFGKRPSHVSFDRMQERSLGRYFEEISAGRLCRQTGEGVHAPAMAPSITVAQDERAELGAGPIAVGTDTGVPAVALETPAGPGTSEQDLDMSPTIADALDALAAARWNPSAALSLDDAAGFALIDPLDGSRIPVDDECAEEAAPKRLKSPGTGAPGIAEGESRGGEGAHCGSEGVRRE